jgi:hypothetical protein
MSRGSWVQSPVWPSFLFNNYVAQVKIGMRDKRWMRTEWWTLHSETWHRLTAVFVVVQDRFCWKYCFKSLLNCAVCIIYVVITSRWTICDLISFFLLSFVTSFIPYSQKQAFVWSCGRFYRVYLVPSSTDVCLYWHFYRVQRSVRW